MKQIKHHKKNKIAPKEAEKVQLKKSSLQVKKKNCLTAKYFWQTQLKRYPSLIELAMICYLPLIQIKKRHLRRNITETS